VFKLLSITKIAEIIVTWRWSTINHFLWYLETFCLKLENLNKIKFEYLGNTEKLYKLCCMHHFGLVYHVYHHFQQYFSYYYIVAVRFIGGGNRSTLRKQTCRKSLTNFITWCYIEYTSPELYSNSQH
jgi:hypothetical protein